MFRKFLFLTIFILLSASVRAADESLTITTYYPSPYGTYNELRLFPHSPAVTVCNAASAGTMYYNSTDNVIYTCNGTTWVSSSGYWAASGTNIYNTNTGNVGIGTGAAGSYAWEKLGVRGGQIGAEQSGGAGWGAADGTRGLRVAWSTGYGASLEAWDGASPKWGISRWNAAAPSVVMQGAYTSNDVNFTGNVAIGGTGAPFGTARLTVLNTLNSQSGMYMNLMSLLSGTMDSSVGYSSVAGYFANQVTKPGGSGMAVGVQGEASSPSAAQSAIGVYAAGGFSSFSLPATGSGVGLIAAGQNWDIWAPSGAPSYFKGMVGIGTSSPIGLAGDLTLSRGNGGPAGAVYFGNAANNAWIYYDGVNNAIYGSRPFQTWISDRRMKSNIKKLNAGLKEILQLEPKTYLLHNIKLEGDHMTILPDASPAVGFIAQDVYKVMPEVVLKPKDEAKSLWGMNSEALLTVAINAIKEQQAQIEELKKEIADLKKTR